MTRARSLFGRFLFGARHWSQAPVAQSPTLPSILLVGIARERSLVGTARERTLVGRNQP